MFKFYKPNNHISLDNTYFINDVELPPVAEDALDFIFGNERYVSGNSFVIPLGTNATLTMSEVVRIDRTFPQTTEYKTSGNTYVRIETTQEHIPLKKRL